VPSLSPRARGELRGSEGEAYDLLVEFFLSPLVASIACCRSRRFDNFGSDQTSTQRC
jgi:hypothetical protein